MADQEQHDEFVHHIAIKLSRELNIINPNDLLARRVIDIAQSNTQDAFIKAAKGFGLSRDSFLNELHVEISSHSKQEAAGLAPQPVHGIAVHDSEVLEPEPVRQGGLMRKDARHAFRAPAKPLEPPTPRTSVLGLDKLAHQKRLEAAQADGDRSRKKPRIDDDPVFKGQNMRHRGEETPSHPGGLSQTAKDRLDEYRRQRERNREGIRAHNEPNRDRPQGIGDFQRRANRRDDGRDRGGRDQRRDGRGWDATPRSERGHRGDDAPSVRVPNVGWDSTPRTQRGNGNDGGWGGARDRRWDAPTPRIVRDGSPEDERGAFGVDVREWEEEQVRLDRDWYSGAEDGALAGDEEHNPLAQYDDLSAIKQAEIETKRVKKISARQAQYNADNDLWEANRMVTSGVATRKGVDLDFEDESESAVHVMVHNLKPPFLDGRQVFTKQLEPINPIRDPTSDMAVFSKKGSALVKEKREQAERAKAAAKLAALGGTALGNIMGVKDEEAEAEGAYCTLRVCG
ncbi:hypothetical protein PUNSTDRAFT_56300 [Punctularia strigosozonata HHB-11173 SS5]|uniref:uncharacterized protein n=1 Tax=Punctularia strigosozonata (strain HHB-11173) TaxID=741275 RepID=UPI000441834B|nr:uncharacterized protein PUNSTDRAFT_56300 [Punctularia strigosozonata HHB-11173 SS5]EIN13223.1 hypothetical protein PUNSTDRAFT_56300 [Punctularia strigosozonata HHB-11173 SS5]